MNSRQTEILKLLLKKENETNVTIHEIAQTLNCSEKTVRNDFKELDEWLKKEYEATIVRKPSIGVRLDITEEKKRVLKLHFGTQNNQPAHTYDQERKETILLMLLDNKVTSLQSLTENFHVSRHVIKQDIEEIKTWIEAFDLIIESKKKIGLKLIGDEKNKRSALLRINQFEQIKNEKTLEKLFSNIEISIAKQQIKKIEKELNKDFTNESLNNLILHLLITVKRIKGKNHIAISKREEESFKAKKEYHVVKRNLEELERPFVIRFPEVEILYFFLHILGSKEKNDIKTTYSDLSPDAHSFVLTIVEKMSQHTNINHEEDRQLYDSLSLHLKSTFERIKHGLFHKNPLLIEIKKLYPYTFATLYNITKELESYMGFTLPEDEIGFLTIHFEASKERLKKNNGENKRVVVVCQMGIGMSQLLTTKLERKFRSLDVIKSVSVDELEDVVKKEKVDFIISTIPIKEMGMPVITVSPLLQKEEEEKMKLFISNLKTIQEMKFEALKKFIRKDFILFKEKAENPDEIIRKLAHLLEKKGYVNEEYVEDSIKREQLSPTTIGGEIAIPHGHPKNVLKQGIAVALLREPILWKREMVSIVFMLSIKETNNEEIKKMFEEISFLGEKSETLEKWKKTKTKDEFYHSI